MQGNQDDTTLLVAFQNGQAAAENAVFKRLFRPLVLYAERITGHMQQAEDIVAESLEKAWDRRQELKTLENLKAFLYRIVRNAGINYTIATKLHRTAHANIEYVAKQGLEEDPVLEREILRVELLKDIYDEIENLPDRCGQVFKGLFIHGLTTEQIAHQLSINVQTVRTQKARAIQLLKTQLLKKGKALAILLLYAFLEKN